MESFRRCVYCRESYPRTDLVRVTYSRQSSQYAINGVPSIQGRSAYVCSNPHCLGGALKGKKLQRSLKTGLSDAILKYLNELLEGLKT